jgi:threonine dehydrogenase-like Zn-dependent dehydrogenase
MENDQDVLAVRYENGAVRVVEAPPPRGPGVRVRISACGICGSDLAMLSGGFPVQGIPGHEIAGALADGTPVAIEPVAPCDTCEYCRSGDYQVCRAGIEIIYGVGRDGGMAEEILVPERCLVALPRGLDPRHAALVEPLAVAVHGLRRAGIRGGERVAIVGGGAIGLCAVAAAAAAGCRVSLAARHDRQREAGARLGAQPLAPGEADVAIDCAGTTDSLAQCAETLRPNGVLLLLAAAWGPLALPGFTFVAKELALTVASMYGRSAQGRDVDAAAALLAATPAIGALLITHRFPLEAAAEAFRTARDRKAGAIKVVLEPGAR